MKPYICAAVSLLLMLASASSGVEKSTKLVYVIPVNGEIERGLVYVIRRGVKEAAEKKADAIILDMDTPGGRVSSTLEIMDIIDSVEVPVIAFVNPRALSGGAIMSLATDAIYMTPGSTIGDAMPINGNGSAIPADLKEKAVSPLAAAARAMATKKGHNIEVAEAMIRIEKELKIGDEIICPAGELLTLTSYEAEKEYGKKKTPLLSKGSVEDIPALLKKLDMEGAEIRTLKVSTPERLARWIDMTAVSGLLLAIGLLAIYLEFKTPGFGIPGITGIILLAVWFWGHNIAGLAGMEEIAIFIVGVVLLALEIFVIPGFGIAGIAGITLIITSLIMAMVEHYPGGTWYPPVTQIQDAMATLGLALAICAVSVAIIARFLPETRLFQRILLTSTLPRDDGYQAGSKNDGLIGATGVAETDLRPAGIANINGRRQTVVSRGDFIPSGSPIVVAQTRGNRIVVDRVSEEKTS